MSSRSRYSGGAISKNIVYHCPLVYCPEVAVLHGAFAFVERESKRQGADVVQHQKGCTDARSLVVIKDCIRRILSEHKPSDRPLWINKLLWIMFHKAFNPEGVKICESEKEEDNTLRKMIIDYRFSSVCYPIPPFHLHFFFDLVKELDWQGPLGKVLLQDEFATSLHCAQACLDFVSSEPAVLSDLRLVAMMVNFLVSCCLVEIVQGCSIDVRQPTIQDTGFLGNGNLSKHFQMPSQSEYERVDKKLVPVLVNALIQFLHLTKQKVSALQTFGDVQSVLECIFSCTVLLGIISFSSSTVSQLAATLSRLLVIEEDDDDREENVPRNNLQKKGLSSQVKDGASLGLPASQQTDLQHGLLQALRDPKCRKVCQECISNILTLQDRHFEGKVVAKPAKIDSNSEEKTDGHSEEKTDGHSEEKMDSSDDKMDSRSEERTDGCSEEKIDCHSEVKRESQTTRVDLCLEEETEAHEATNHSEEATEACLKMPSKSLGSVLVLELELLASKYPIKMAEALREFYQLMQSQEREEVGEGSFGEDVQKSMLLLFSEVEIREEEEEKRKQNPDLSEVIERVTKKLPRWKRCLHFGLAKRDLHEWWFSGFLDLLRKNSHLLQCETDVKHLLSVLVLTVKSTPPVKAGEGIEHLSELIITVFSRLPLPAQEVVIHDHYLDPETVEVPLVKNFEHVLMIFFNKLSASSASKELCAVLKLALHNPLAFTDHAVRVAVGNTGQDDIVIKVLQLMPAVCRSTHPQKHAESTLLCHCVHTALHRQILDQTEQRNAAKFVASLVQKENSWPPLLSPAEFLSTSVLPFITLHTKSSISSPVNTDFAMRLLIGVLQATRCVEFSDWLREMHPAALVVCCAEILDDCLELVTDNKSEMGTRVRMKTSVLKVLELLHEHLQGPERPTAEFVPFIKDGHVRWMQDRCAVLDWTVPVYLAEFLTPESGDKTSQLALVQVAQKCLREAATDLLPLLRLAAISKQAEQTVQQLVVGSPLPLIYQEATVLNCLCQLLPHLLVPEGKRVVRLLLNLVTAGCVDMAIRCLFVDSFPVKSFPDVHVGVCVSQLLMDAVVLIVQNPEIHGSQSVCLHVSQVLVAGLQEVLNTALRTLTQTKAKVFLKQQVFSHICVTMSTAPEVMLEPLFVLLLDLLSRFQGRIRRESFQSVLTVPMLGIALIPKETMQKILLKRLQELQR